VAVQVAGDRGIAAPLVLQVAQLDLTRGLIIPGAAYTAVLHYSAYVSECRVHQSLNVAEVQIDHG